MRTEPTRRDSLSDRQAERRCLERVIDQHRHARIPGRAKQLDLEHVYISLLVGEFVPPEKKPDQRSRRDGEVAVQQRTGIVSATDALFFKRLGVLGDPGSGKTTLLQSLALRIAQGHRRTSQAAAELKLEEWAREDSFPQVLGSLLGIAALIVWVAGPWSSSSRPAIGAFLTGRT